MNGMPDTLSQPVDATRATIRPLRRSDRDGLQALLVATGMFTEDEVAIALELIDAVLDRPEQRDYIIAVYADDQGPAGYYCIGPTPATDGTFDLYWIAVAPAAQGQGIGRKLIAHAEQLVQRSGGRLIIAETSSQPKYEPTRLFYLRAGYAEIARIKEYYRPGDDLVMYGKYVKHS